MILFLLALTACTTDETVSGPPSLPTKPAEVTQTAPPAPTVGTAVEAPKPGSRVFFVEPLANATVSSPIAIKFGVEGMEVRPAGTMDPGTGHHHLIIDGAAPAKGEVVMADDTHIHYGKGQTETEISLAPGPHTLTMQFADGAHRSYGPEMSTTITVTVSEAATAAATPPAAPATPAAEGGK
jgi:hypothetical protein